jgi:hypothetical protein
LNENKINFLFEKMTKKETSEQTQTGVTTKVTTEKITTVTPTALNSPQGVNIDGINLKNQGGQLVAKQLGENELDEKFESKAQQGLFWARCNKCKSDDCKWCKMAKEFSKSTSKKQYEKMPEKKHPEKTVKYKKKETKEGYLENVGKKVTDTYAKKFASFTPGLAWGGLKEDYNKIIEKYTQPTMKKRDLLKLIESEIKRKKGLNEDFYYSEEMDEDFDLFANEPATKEPLTKPKTPTKTPEREKPRRKPSRETPYEDPSTKPMGDAPVKPLTKPKTPTKTPEREKPRRKPSRETPYEDPGTKPMGDSEKFDFVMEKLYNRISKIK